MAWNWREHFLDLVIGSARRAATLRNHLRLRRTQLPKPRREETILVRSGSRVLDARFVAGKVGLPVVLFCHGIGDTLALWDGVQAFFEKRGIGSMVFSYSGYGKSTGRVRARHCDEDFLSAHKELMLRIEPGVAVFVLGYSMGTGVAARGVLELQDKPAGLFLCSGFSSFREAGREIGAPRWLTGCVPNAWDNADVLSAIKVPVVVVHSDGDRLFSMKMARKLIAGLDAELIAVHGFSHSDPFFRLADEYWSPIADRILRAATKKESSAR